MSLAAQTRQAANDHPFLVTALRAGVVNYTAAARYLSVDGETEAVSTALRRYSEELSNLETEQRDARVTMESGIGPVESNEESLLAVGNARFGSRAGDFTAILVTGTVDALALRSVLGTLELEGISVEATAVTEDTLVVVVSRLDGANALRAVERALESVPIR